MLSDGSWISDINYHGSRAKIVPAGTPVRHTGYGRWRMLVEIDGKTLAIGNDYSRTLPMADFARRYVLAEDPRPVLQGYPEKIREAILTRRVAPGMTREQVLMAVGYPIASYNPDLDAPLWRYWIDSSSEYQVFWTEGRRVDRIFGAPEVRAKVTID